MLSWVSELLSPMGGYVVPFFVTKISLKPGRRASRGVLVTHMTPIIHNIIRDNKGDK